MPTYEALRKLMVQGILSHGEIFERLPPVITEENTADALSMVPRSGRIKLFIEIMAFSPNQEWCNTPDFRRGITILKNFILDPQSPSKLKDMEFCHFCSLMRVDQDNKCAECGNTFERPSN